MNAGNHILMIAGEPSGDLHGAGVVQALRQMRPGVQIFGIGGDKMRDAGQEQLYSTREMAIIGFTEVIRHLPFLRRVMRHLQEEIRRRRPACAILIDYPGFNLRLAQFLKENGVPVLYYIAPQVWAWGARRVPKMAKRIDQMAVVFPFEVELFENAGLPTTFVGHPLLDGLQPRNSEAAFRSWLGIAPQDRVLGLLPGSRKQEVERLLPDMLRTAQLLREHIWDLQVVIARSPDLPGEIYQPFIQEAAAGWLHLAQDDTYSVMAYSDACIVASGTATLETACFSTPMAVVYRISRLSYAIGKRLVKLKNIGLVNIVAGEEVVPEFVQDRFEPEHVARALLPLLTDARKAAAVQAKLHGVRAKLGEPGASKRVAELAARLAWPK